MNWPIALNFFYPISVLRRDRLSNFGTQNANGFFDPIWDIVDKDNLKTYYTGYDTSHGMINAYGMSNYDCKNNFKF